MDNYSAGCYTYPVYPVSLNLRAFLVGGSRITDESAKHRHS